jgi:hypothetical protein
MPLERVASRCEVGGTVELFDLHRAELSHPPREALASVSLPLLGGLIGQICESPGGKWSLEAGMQRQ